MEVRSNAAKSALAGPGLNAVPITTLVVTAQVCTAPVQVRVCLPCPAVSVLPLVCVITTTTSTSLPAVQTIVPVATAEVLLADSRAFESSVRLLTEADAVPCRARLSVRAVLRAL